MIAPITLICVGRGLAIALPPAMQNGGSRVALGWRQRTCGPPGEGMPGGRCLSLAAMMLQVYRAAPAR